MPLCLSTFLISIFPSIHVLILSIYHLIINYLSIYLYLSIPFEIIYPSMYLSICHSPVASKSPAARRRFLSIYLSMYYSHLSIYLSKTTLVSYLQLMFGTRKPTNHYMPGLAPLTGALMPLLTMNKRRIRLRR